METTNEIFFSEHGLTSTSASHLADIAQEVIAGCEAKLMGRKTKCTMAVRWNECVNA